MLLFAQEPAITAIVWNSLCESPYGSPSSWGKKREQCVICTLGVQFLRDAGNNCRDAWDPIFFLEKELPTRITRVIFG